MREDQACFACWRPDRHGLATTGLRVPSNPLKPCAAVSIKAPSTPHCPQGPTSGHQPAQRPQVYCYTPPTADLRPRTGAQDHVQRHAQACCEPPTLARGLGPTRRSTRSRAAKCEPTWTSALPGVPCPIHHGSNLSPPISRPTYVEGESSMLEDVELADDQTGTVWLPTPLPINRLNVLNHIATGTTHSGPPS